MNSIQRAVLEALKRGPAAASELSAITQVRHSNVSRALTSMKVQGAVRRCGERPARWELTGVPLQHGGKRGSPKKPQQVVPARVSIPTLAQLFGFLIPGDMT
jgi:DNA-binding transcriptional ArsR family regulator